MLVIASLPITGRKGKKGRQAWQEKSPEHREDIDYNQARLNLNQNARKDDDVPFKEAEYQAK
jgi:hypothetical protein